MSKEKDIALANRILSAQLNKGRRGRDKSFTDRKYFNLWKRVYPDTYKQVIRAMLEFKQH